MSRNDRVQALRQALTTESGLNRLVLRENLRQVLPHLSPRAAGGLQLASHLLPVAAAVVGAVVVRRTSGFGPVLRGVTSAVTWALPLYRAWRRSGGKAG